MEQWLDWARGPMFRFAIAVMLLGLIRLAVLTVMNLVSLTRNARNKHMSGGVVARDTVGWLFPFTRVPAQNRFFTVVSVAFHICIIVVPIFLAGHVLLLQDAIGVGWPAINQILADYMTLFAIAAGLVLFSRRVSTVLTRSLCRAQDYVIPVMIVLLFTSGYLATHPAVNPFSYSATMLTHALTGDLILMLIPFSKLSHVLLFPFAQLVSEMGWHLAPRSGARVAAELGKEGEPI